jgi:hypothetical protein
MGAKGLPWKNYKLDAELGNSKIPNEKVKFCKPSSSFSLLLLLIKYNIIINTNGIFFL